MKKITILKILKLCLTASVLFMLLPWFSFNPRMAVIFYGIDTLAYTWIPFVIVLMYLFIWEKDKKLYILLTEAALLCLIGVHIYEFFSWQSRVTGSDINISASLRVALPTFWLSLAAICITWVIFQLYFCRLHRKLSKL